MNQRVNERLAELQKEYEAGQKVLAEMDAKRQSVASTLLRIEGAMQVLRELIAAESPEGAGAAEAPAETSGPGNPS